MDYKRAEGVIPVELLEMIQEYVDGEYIYIPRKSNNRRGWGEKSGYRSQIEERNREIIRRNEEGETVRELALSYFLSEKSIYRILSSHVN